MRFEVNDEAARLRRSLFPIECGRRTEIQWSQAIAEIPDPYPPTQRGCDDCGHDVVTCRCGHGEG